MTDVPIKSSKQVIVIRKDIICRKGKIIAQACHASLGVFTKDAILIDGDFEEGHVRQLEIPLTEAAQHWLSSSFRKICVGVNSEAELLALETKCKELGIIHCLIQDNGVTEFHGVKTYTALAVGPDWDERVDLVTGGLGLM